MHRIDGPGATVDNKFTAGNPGGGIPATTVTPEWLTEVQEEILSVVEAAGIPPVKGTANQLWAATMGRLLSEDPGDGASLVAVEDEKNMFPGIQKTIEAVLQVLGARTVVSLKEPRFAGVFDGVADDSAAYTAALAAAGVNGCVLHGVTELKLAATVYAPYGAWVKGQGWAASKINRSGDYGDTFVFGSDAPGGYCGPARVSDVWMRHGTMYATGDAALDTIATTGAHIRMYGCQGAVVENCWLWRMPYQIVFEGGSVIKVTNNSLKGIWDHTNAALQEGCVQLYLKKNANFGTPVTLSVLENEFNGANVNGRDVNLTSSDGTVVRSMTELIGSQYAVLCEGGEDMTFAENYFGGMNENCMLFKPVVGSSVIDLRIHDNHFDGARFAQVLFDSYSTAGYSLLVNLHDNNFNGEALSKHAVQAINSAGNAPSLVNFTVAKNTCLQHYGSNFVLFAAAGGTVNGNPIESWNTLDATQNDGQWSAAILVDSANCKHVDITDNVIGGGGNDFQNNVANTFTYKGIVVGAACVNVRHHDNHYAGIRDGANFRVGPAQTPNQYKQTVQANYQMLPHEDIFLRAHAGTAANVVNLPLYPMAGRECVVKDSFGNAAAWIIIVGTGDGTAIDGAASINITSDYGYMRFRFDGVEWGRVG